METQSKLKDLFNKSNKKSIKWEKYFFFYEQIFSKFRDKKITFVEIGVLDGGSLEIWKKYFGDKSRIIGIDKNPECKKLENKNFEIYIGSQSDPNFWKNFYNDIGSVDIVLDDGGHTNDQQIITLVESIKNINDGGIHIVEDVHSSYQKQYGNPCKFSFINFSKKIIDDINFKFPNMKKFDYSLNGYIYSVEFFESIVAFKINRKLCYENNMLINNGKSSNIIDVTLDKEIFDFRLKYKFLYKFKITQKIERFLIKILYKVKSNRLKNYFK